MYTFESRIRYSETDSDERLALTALTDYFQDCSTFQSEDLGVGVKYLQKQHLVWVLSSWQIVIDEYPMLGDHVTVGTFPYQFKTFMGSRNFFMDGADGKRYAYANSLWTLLDTETMQPARVTEEMTTRYIPEEKLPMEYLGRRIDMPEGLTAGEPIAVRAENIDYHGHVNNSQYIHMIRPLLPESISRIRIEYKRQTRLGEWLTPMTKEENGVTFIALCADGEPHVNIEITH